MCPLIEPVASPAVASFGAKAFVFGGAYDDNLRGFIYFNWKKIVNYFLLF